MKSPKHNNAGFGTIELVLIVIIVILIGAVGWFVYNNKKSSDISVKGDANIVQPNANKKIVDATADWTIYKSDAGRYSLKYPNNWLAASHPELCSPGILLVAPEESSLGHCGSESFGQMTFIGMDDGSNLCYELGTDSSWKNVTRKTITVSGIELVRQSAISANETAGNGSLPVGTIEVTYCYGSKTYGFMARYDQRPTDKNVLNDFDTIVTKTLTITN